MSMSIEETKSSLFETNDSNKDDFDDEFGNFEEAATCSEQVISDNENDLNESNELFQKNLPSDLIEKNVF